jgi:hypothetical protein
MYPTPEILFVQEKVFLHVLLNTAESLWYFILCKDFYTNFSRLKMFIAALFTIAKLWKQTRCPTTDKWIKKMWYLYTMKFYSAPKIMKSCHLQVNRWIWRASCEVKLARFRRPKAACFLSYMECRPNTNTAIL